MKKICGIYQILNKENNKRYVGGTTNLTARKRHHFSDLRLHGHTNPNLQSDFDLFGEDQFEFSVLEYVYSDEESVIISAEQKWIDLLHPEYNINTIAGKYIGDYIRTPEALAKRADTLRGRKHTEEHKEKIRQSLLKNPPNKGRKFSDEFKKKLSIAMTGEKNPNYGLKRSAETRKKQSEKAAKTYVGAVSPDGVVYSPIHNMREFCKVHGLCESSMVALMRDRIKTHKGWIKYLGEVKDDYTRR